ncbi:MAG: hypothetical protein HC845_12995 [Akkermansiaceae bacterium]|nr:hypothetical protein [Akkermansiaceae bacterium]
MQAVSRIAALALLFIAGNLAQAADLTAGQKAAIGKKIWQNECAGSVAGLTTWNAGEEFPSLGIGHFIWYPAGFKGRFEESWPSFVAFANQRGVEVPAVGRERHSPWRSKAEFQADFKSERMTALRKWLAGNVTLQTDFIMARSRAALPKILAAAPGSERQRIEANYHKVSSSAQGTYALIDYVNFKGEGTNVAERYNGRGWGILQVLGEMKDVPSGSAAAMEFSAAAKRVLSRRIQNAPAARGEKRWEAGWHNRCATYARPL